MFKKIEWCGQDFYVAKDNLAGVCEMPDGKIKVSFKSTVELPHATHQNFVTLKDTDIETVKNELEE